MKILSLVVKNENRNLERYIGDSMRLLIGDIDINLIPLITINSNEVMGGGAAVLELIYDKHTGYDTKPPIVNSNIFIISPRFKLNKIFIPIPFTKYYIVRRKKLISVFVRQLEYLFNAINNSEFYLDLLKTYDPGHLIKLTRRW